MPLWHGKSEKAFKHNIRAEMHAGKPQKQSLAIAYATKRKAEQHKAQGGEMKCYAHGTMDCPHCMAEGGEYEKGVHKPFYGKDSDWPGESQAGEHTRDAKENRELGYHKTAGRQREFAHAEHGKILAEMKGMKKPHLYAHGGEASETIGRLMEKHYSKGGQVANDVEDLADYDPNEFDDLVLTGGLEHGEEGSMEHGDEAEEHDRNDPVMRAMMKYKRQRNPRPA